MRVRVLYTNELEIPSREVIGVVMADSYVIDIPNALSYDQEGAPLPLLKIILVRGIQTYFTSSASIRAK